MNMQFYDSDYYGVCFGNYELTFEKNALNSPYNVVIRYFDNYNIDTEMNSINSEYGNTSIWEE